MLAWWLAYVAGRDTEMRTWEITGNDCTVLGAGVCDYVVAAPIFADDDGCMALQATFRVRRTTPLLVELSEPDR